MIRIELSSTHVFSEGSPLPSLTFPFSDARRHPFVL